VQCPTNLTSFLRANCTILLINARKFSTTCPVQRLLENKWRDVITDLIVGRLTEFAWKIRNSFPGAAGWNCWIKNRTKIHRSSEIYASCKSQILLPRHEKRGWIYLFLRI
jgi:hypothetical protein